MSSTEKTLYINPSATLKFTYYSKNPTHRSLSNSINPIPSIFTIP